MIGDWWWWWCFFLLCVVYCVLCAVLLLLMLLIGMSIIAAAIADIKSLNCCLLQPNVIGWFKQQPEFKDTRFTQGMKCCIMLHSYMHIVFGTNYSNFDGIALVDSCSFPSCSCWILSISSLISLCMRIYIYTHTPTTYANKSIGEISFIQRRHLSFSYIIDLVCNICR